MKLSLLLLFHFFFLLHARPWDSPGKSTGVGCHFLLQCVKVKSESEVAQSCPTLSDLMDCSLPGSSVHGIFQARVLEWGAIAFSRPSCYTMLNACVFTHVYNYTLRQDHANTQTRSVSLVLDFTFSSSRLPVIL